MGVYRHQAWTPRLAKPQAVFLAFQSVSVGIPDAADLQYRRPRPPQTRLPNRMSAALVGSAPVQATILQFPRSQAPYERRGAEQVRLPQAMGAALLAAPIPSISGTMSFTLTDLSIMILVDRPTVTTWTNVSSRTTTWTAPLT